MLIFIVSLVAFLLFFVMYLNYKRNNDKKQFIINILYLGTIIGLGIIGRVTHSISAIYMAQYIALFIAITGFLYYLFTKRFIWWTLFAPIAVLALYLILAYTAGDAQPIVVG